MTAKIIPLNNITRLDIPIERVLEGAKDQLEDVVLMGWDKDGELYFASTISDGGSVLWLMERCKQALFDAIDEDGD